MTFCRWSRLAALLVLATQQLAGVVRGAESTLGANGWGKIPSSRTPPSPRFYHVVEFDADENRLVLWSGIEEDHSFVDDLYQYSFDTREYEQLPVLSHDNPLGRQSCASGLVDRKLFIWGGRTARSLASDGWVYDMQQLRWDPWVTSNTPSARHRVSHTVFYDAQDVTRPFLAVFGGDEFAVERGSDMHIIPLSTDPSEAVWVELPQAGGIKPDGRSTGCLAPMYHAPIAVPTGTATDPGAWTGAAGNPAGAPRDARQTYLYLMGGLFTDNDASHADVWRYDLSNGYWTEISGSVESNSASLVSASSGASFSPTQRYLSQCMADPSRGAIYQQWGYSWEVFADNTDVLMLDLEDPASPRQYVADVTREQGDTTSPRARNSAGWAALVPPASDPAWPAVATGPRGAHHPDAPPSCGMAVSGGFVSDSDVVITNDLLVTQPGEALEAMRAAAAANPGQAVTVAELPMWTEAPYFLAPRPRWGHSTSVVNGHMLVLFGDVSGADGEVQSADDAWSLDLVLNAAMLDSGSAEVDEDIGRAARTSVCSVQPARRRRGLQAAPGDDGAGGTARACEAARLRDRKPRMEDLSEEARGRAARRLQQYRAMRIRQGAGVGQAYSRALASTLGGESGKRRRRSRRMLQEAHGHSTGLEDSSSSGPRALQGSGVLSAGYGLEVSMSFLPVVAEGRVPDARSHAVVVAMGNLVYAFGGLAASSGTAYNDLWVLDPRDSVDTFGSMQLLANFTEKSPRWSQIEPNNAANSVPTPVYGGCGAASDTKLWVFGGRAGVGFLQNDVWSFSLDSMEWRHEWSASSMQTAAERIAAIDVQLGVTGGTAFPTAQQECALSFAPSGGTGATSDVGYVALWMAEEFAETPSGSLWLFSTASKSWQLLFEHFASRSRFSHIATPSGRSLVTIGGWQYGEYLQDEALALLMLDADGGVSTGGSPSGACVAKVSDIGGAGEADLVIDGSLAPFLELAWAFGGRLRKNERTINVQGTNNVDVGNVSVLAQHTDLAGSPESRTTHVCTAAQLVAALGATCSPGSYRPSSPAAGSPAGQCQACPQGLWCAGGATQPVPCPAGHYLPSPGGASYRQCMPCPAGFFASSEGTSACEACPEPTSEVQSSCPVGSVRPASYLVASGLPPVGSHENRFELLENGTGLRSILTSQQPVLVDDDPSVEVALLAVSFVWVVFALLALVVALLALLRDSYSDEQCGLPWRTLMQLDLFVAFHDEATLPTLLQSTNASQQLRPVLQRQTAMGGACVCVFVLFALSVCLTTLFFFVFDAKVAGEQLVPAHVFDPEELVDAVTGADVGETELAQEGLSHDFLHGGGLKDSRVTGTIQLTVALDGYSGDCTAQTASQSSRRLAGNGGRAGEAGEVVVEPSGDAAAQGWVVNHGGLADLVRAHAGERLRVSGPGLAWPWEEAHGAMGKASRRGVVGAADPDGLGLGFGGAGLLLNSSQAAVRGPHRGDRHPDAVRTHHVPAGPGPVDPASAAWTALTRLASPRLWCAWGSRAWRWAAWAGRSIASRFRGEGSGGPSRQQLAERKGRALRERMAAMGHRGSAAGQSSPVKRRMARGLGSRRAQSTGSQDGGILPVTASCAPGISANLTGLLAFGSLTENMTMTCARVGSRVCLASITCESCEVSTSTATFDLQMAEPSGSSALRLYVELVADSALPADSKDEVTKSVTSLLLLPSQADSVFRGVAPTDVEVQLTRAFYQDTRDSVALGLQDAVASRTGHHLEISQLSRGSQVSFSEVQEQSGVGIEVRLVRLESALQSRLTDTQSIVTLALSVLGALGTAFTVFGVMLRQLEAFVFGTYGDPGSGICCCIRCCCPSLWGEACRRCQDCARLDREQEARDSYLRQFVSIALKLDGSVDTEAVVQAEKRRMHEQIREEVLRQVRRDSGNVGGGGKGTGGKSRGARGDARIAASPDGVQPVVGAGPWVPRGTGTGTGNGRALATRAGASAESKASFATRGNVARPNRRQGGGASARANLVDSTSGNDGYANGRSRRALSGGSARSGSSGSGADEGYAGSGREEW